MLHHLLHFHGCQQVETLTQVSSPAALEDNLWGNSQTFFTDRMPFLLPNQQCQSIEGNSKPGPQSLAWPHPSFVLDSWRKGNFSLYAGSLMPVLDLVQLTNIEYGTYRTDMDMRMHGQFTWFRRTMKLQCCGSSFSSQCWKQHTQRTATTVKATRASNKISCQFIHYYYYVLLTGFFSRTTWVSRHQKGKPFCSLLEQDMTG